MNLKTRPRRLGSAFCGIFTRTWTCMRLTMTIAGVTLLVNALLYAFGVGGLAPARVVEAMTWLIAPFLTLLDHVAPPISCFIRFSASVWDITSLIEVLAVIAGLLGFIIGLIMFNIELFRFVRDLYRRHKRHQ